MSVTFGPRFTRWRALFLDGTRYALLQLQTPPPPPELAVQYIQPSAASARPLNGSGMGARPLNGSSAELDLVVGSLAGFVPSGGSGASMTP